MIIHSVAIVLKRFPYSETSIIARCFVRGMGKVSFIVHGAHRKKSPMGAYFQPINCLDLVYYFKESRDLQTISKVAFSNNWSVIPTDLKKISGETRSMANLEGLKKETGTTLLIPSTCSISSNNQWIELFSRVGRQISRKDCELIASWAELSP